MYLVYKPYGAAVESMITFFSATMSRYIGILGEDWA